MNRTAKQADDRARMGYNLSDQGAAALKGRLQQRFDQGLITQKSRQERLKTLLAQRKEKQAGATAAQQKPAAPVVSATTENAGSKRLAILQGSLTKKEADLNRRFDEHFADVRSANGQPLNDKRNGPSTMARWERQSDSIRSSKTGIEKTKRAIEREKNLIDNVNSLELPPAIKTAMESGNITQWRKHPNRFFVKGVEKGRIVYFPETGTIGHHYLMDIPKEQYPLFRDTYNQLRKDLQKPAAAPAPLSRAAALVQSVRSKPGYGVARASAAGNRELIGLRMKEKNKPATPPPPVRTLEEARADRYRRAKEAGVQSNPDARYWKARRLRESRNNTRTSPEGRATRKQAAEMLLSLRSQGPIGRGLASIIRENALVRRSWGYTANNPRDVTNFGPLGNAKKIIEQSAHVRGSIEQKLTDSQLKAKELLTPTGKLSQASVNKSTWVSALTRGGTKTQAEALVERVKMLRGSASAALKQLRILNTAKVPQSSYISKPESFRGENNNHLQQLKVAMQGKKTVKSKSDLPSFIVPIKKAGKPPKFSRGGQLAPGRGTEERKQDARFLLTLPKEARSAIVLAKRTFKNKGTPGSNPLGPSYAHDVYDASIKARKQFNEKDKILKSTAYKIIEAGKALKDIIKPAKTASGFTVRSAYAADLQLPSSMGGPKKGYIAKITDTDPKYKLKREFLKGSYDGAGTNYKITEKGIYETQSQSLQNRNKIDRTYELQGRNKTKELWLSNDQSGMRRGSVERAIRLLKLFSKKQP
jgi:hypothetical protein